MLTPAFLSEVEPLTHRERVHRVMLEGRKAAQGDGPARALLDELWGSPDAYARQLSLMSVYGSRDGARVLAAVLDPSRTVRRRAARMVALFCDDAQASQALDAIVGRRVLCRAVAGLARRKRFGPVDAFLASRKRNAQGRREPFVIDLLPLGTEAAVSSNQHDIEQGGGPLTWSRVCDRHPSVAAGWLLSDLSRSTSLDARQRYRVLPALPQLARTAPDACLTLVRALFERGEEPSTVAPTLRKLVRLRPREAFDLIKARHESGQPARPPGAFGVMNFDKVAHLLGPERLDYIVRHAWGTLSDGKRGVRWFLRLAHDDQKAVLRAFLHGGRGGWGAFLFRYLATAPAEEQKARERLFDKWSRAAQASDGAISPDVLDWLPRDLREREARRHLFECATLASKPDRRLPYARLLPFGEAKDVLGPFLGHPEGEERAKAQRVLIASVFHDSKALPDALANVKARKFEQDPVRRVMLEALLRLPLARYRAEHLEAVGLVLADALDAADLSSATAGVVEQLVVKLFRLDGAWGARWITRLLAVRGSVSTLGLGDGLTRREAEALSPAIAELASTWATQERAAAVIWLARSLGIRLPVVLPLLDALERLARELPFASVSAAALHLFAQHDRPRLARLVPDLLRNDPSYVLIPTVAHFVSMRRQDLLSPLIASKPMTGRFATGRTHWVVAFDVGLGRWTSGQQETYGAGLRALLADEKRDVPTLRFAITTLSRLAFVDASSILPFASDPRQPVREMAIRALPWLDARQGVSTLVEALGDDRARWAIYALRKVFSEMRSAEVLAELRAVPRSKVTVAKEVVRLLGELGGDDAFAELLALDAPGTHRDVRIALLRALWDHLESPATWPVFERAVRDPDWIVASKLADIPLGRLSTESEDRVVDLLATILGRAEPEARLDLLKRAAYLPLTDAKRALFRRLLEHVGARDPDEAGHALWAALMRMNPGEVSAVVQRLRDLLSMRRHLVALLPIIAQNLGPYARPHFRSVAEGLLGALEADPHTAPHYLTLGARLWGYRALGDAIIALAQKDLLYHEVFEAALGAVRACVHPSLLDERLGEHADWRVRRLGLAALVDSAGPKDGWTVERRARLSTYQRDKAPGVSGPASFVFPP